MNSKPQKAVKTDKNDERRGFASIEGWLFMLLVVMEAGFITYLVNDRLLVGWHDEFQYFTLQYYFLNNVVNYGEIPQWIPYMTHGTSAVWWHLIQAGILQNILMLTGGLFKTVNFLPIFYTGVFVGELLLLTGVWLLGRRFFASPWTVFFVSVSSLGTCIWLTQPWWNFHLYYAIPLILYFIHRFIDRGQWRYAFLAGNLLFIQSLGNLPYFLPVISLVIFLYFFFYFVANYEEILKKVKGIRLGPASVCCLLLTLLSFVVLYAVMNAGTEQLVNYTSRGRDRSITLDVFLNYGGRLSWKAWLEMLLGVPPALDYSLYAGIFCVPLILAGIVLNTNRRNIHFLLAIIVLFLFSMGTFVSVFFYFYWPVMNYFRHLMLVSPIIKVFLGFLAGFGLDGLFWGRARRHQGWPIIVTSLVLALLMLGLSLTSWHLYHAYPNNYEFFVELIDDLVPAYLPVFVNLLNDDTLTSRLFHTAVFSLTASVFFGIVSFVKSGRCYLPLMVLLMTFSIGDIYLFKLAEVKLKTVPLNAGLYETNAFQPLPYEKRRATAFYQNNPRAELLRFLPVQYVTYYWTMHAFTFKDQLGSPFRTDYMLSPLDSYLRAYWGQSIHDSTAALGGHSLNNLAFPEDHPAALKISGVTEDKIQFFSEAVIMPSADMIASSITNPAYSGDRVFLLPTEAGTDNDLAGDHPGPSGLSGRELSANHRLALAYQVGRFDSNNLEISVDTGDRLTTWLLYSDTWHPAWRATVNGQAVPVYRANLAYKAVRLKKGLNHVHFYFQSRPLNLFYRFLGIDALFWLVMLVFLAGKIVFKPGFDPETLSA